MKHPFNNLEAFIALAKHLNFSRASESIGLSQPAFSRQIANLEVSLGVQLFLRNRHQVHMTREGRQFFDRIHPLLELFRIEVGVVRDSATTLSGDLVIGCYREIGQHYFFDLFLDFTEKLPDVNLDVRYLSGPEMLDGLRRGDLHFAIMVRPTQEPDLKCIKLLTEELILVTSEKSTKGQRLEHLDVITYRDQDPGLAQYLRRFRQQLGIRSLREIIRVNSHVSMLAALQRQPNTAAVIPKILLSKGLIALSDHVLSQNLYLVNTDRSQNPKMQLEFKNFLLNFVRGQDKSL